MFKMKLSVLSRMIPLIPISLRYYHVMKQFSAVELGGVCLEFSVVQIMYEYQKNFTFAIIIVGLILTTESAGKF